MAIGHPDYLTQPTFESVGAAAAYSGNWLTAPSGKGTVTVVTGRGIVNYCRVWFEGTVGDTNFAVEPIIDGIIIGSCNRNTTNPYTGRPDPGLPIHAIYHNAEDAEWLLVVREGLSFNESFALTFYNSSTAGLIRFYYYGTIQTIGN